MTMYAKSTGNQSNGDADITIPYTPSGAVTARQCVVQDTLFGVATADIAASTKGSLQIVGVMKFPQAAVTISAGEPAYYDADGDPVDGTAGSGAVTNVKTGNTRIGHFVEAAAATGNHVLTYFAPMDPNEDGS